MNIDSRNIIPIIMGTITLVGIFIYPIYHTIIEELEDRGKIDIDSIWSLIDDIWGTIIIVTIFEAMFFSFLANIIPIYVCCILMTIIYIIVIAISIHFYSKEKKKYHGIPESKQDSTNGLNDEDNKEVETKNYWEDNKSDSDDFDDGL